MKKSPFTVPEGYFDDFAEKMRPWETAFRRQGSVARRVRRLGTAAAVAAVLIAGALLFPDIFRPEYADDEDVYVSFLYSDLISEADPELIFIYGEDSLEDDGFGYGLSQDDIVEYLIYSGTSAEDAVLMFEADDVVQY